MSIIQEALKKAQNYIESQRPSQKGKVEQARPLPEMSEQAIHPEKRSFKQKTLTPFLLLAFITLGIFAAIQFLHVRKTKLDSSAKIDFSDTASHQEIIYKPAAPKIEPAKPIQDAKPSDVSSQYPKFVLNGIMYLNTKPQAIVNNSVVMEGDMVGGAKVIKINRNKVTLQFNDVQITLSLKK